MRSEFFAGRARLSWRYCAFIAALLVLAGMAVLPGQAVAATGSASPALVTELSAGPGYVTAGTEVAGTLVVQARGNMTVEAVGTYSVFGFWEDSSGTYHDLPVYTMTVGAAAPGSGPLGISGNWNLELDSEFSGSSLDPSVWQTGWF